MAEPKSDFPLKTRIAGFLLSLILRFIFYTSRKEYVNLPAVKKLLDEDQPFILVAWHNRNILSSFSYLAHKKKGREWVPLASASKDGSIATAAMKHLGVTCIRGSSSRGGTAALRAMLRHVKQGDDLGITPDGPRGPKYKVQAGVVTTAKMTGCPVLAVSYQAKRKKILKSWDSMIVPYPFNRLRYVYGEPISVPRKASEEELEAFRVRIEEEMMRVCEAAEF